MMINQRESIFSSHQNPGDNLVPVKPWKILIIDDDVSVHDVTRLVLSTMTFEGRGLELISGYSASDAKRLIDENPDTVVVFLDVIMETNHAGLSVVEYIRNELNISCIRIIIRTGEAGQFSEDEVFEGYDINAFLEKSEMTSHLLKSFLKTELRSYRMINQIDKAREHENILRLAIGEEFVARNGFLAMMTHELRSPMQSILGFRDVIEEEIDSLNISEDKRALFRKYLHYQEESSHRLLNLINNLLDLSKLESNQMDFNFKRADLREAVASVEAELLSLLSEKSLRLTVDFANVDTQINHDPFRIMQVLINLVNNAIKFSPQNGEIQIIFSENEIDVNSATLVFMVVDQGVGIPVSELESIFNKFSQSSITKSDHIGTGLGLTVVREIIAAHGGTVMAQNNPLGIGSRFIVTLPRNNKV